jgi:hypothetical protein
MQQTATLISGDLFHLAAQQYGDPLQWIRIALSNQLTDAFIQSTTPVTLLIPAPLDPTPQGVTYASTSIPMVL